MQLEDGVYVITCAKPGVGHLSLSNVVHPTLPPYYFIVGESPVNVKENWKVVSLGATYKIYSSLHPRAGWEVRGDQIFAAEARQDEFSIEPAGEGVYRIHLPNQDEVATLESAGTEQLHLAPENGTDAQLWTFTPVEGLN